MIALDSNVVIAAFASWHSSHDQARAVVRRGARLPAHAAAEAFSVLTRLPPPHRASPQIAAEFLTRQFPDPMLTLSEAGLRRSIAMLADAGLGGGAIYDAIVAASCLEAEATLISADRRAAPIYDLIGIEFEMLD